MSCVLLVEDEMCLAMMLEDVLAGAGYEVLCVSNLAAAEEITRKEAIDVAILDVNLGKGKVYPLADQLDARGIRYMFTTAYERSTLPERFQDRPLLQKPYSPETVVSRVGEVIGAN
jgi:DNA-binding response OmpR family regulator